MGAIEIVNIKRWHWIAVSLIVGLLIGYVQQLPREQWNKVFGETLIQPHFEDGLIRERDGQRWFRNLVIYPERVEVDGRKQPIYIVAGDYFNGKLETQNGQSVAVWRPRCYIAEVPYKPARPLAGFPANGTVLDYLNVLRDKGVRYRYAWWRDPKWGMTLWTAGSFVLIGLIWPSVVNLLAFGSIFRPKREKGIDLSKVKPSPPAEAPKPQVTDADLEQVDQLSEKLELALAAEASSSAPPTAASEQPAPIRQLTAQKLELSAEEKAKQEKEFGKDEDDYYPTERHAHPQEPH